MQYTGLDVVLLEAIMNSSRGFEEYLARKGNQTPSQFLFGEVKAGILKLDPAQDPELDPETPEFRAAVILIAAAFLLGPNVDLLVSFTHYSRTFVETVADRMRAYGFWVDGEVRTDEWLEGDKITGVFWAHCLAAIGKVHVERTEDGQVWYSAII
jgi:hypothetical protein